MLKRDTLPDYVLRRSDSVCTRNPKLSPETRNLAPKPETRKQRPEKVQALNPKPGIRNLTLEARNRETQTHLRVVSNETGAESVGGRAQHVITDEELEYMVRPPRMPLPRIQSS